VPDLLGRGREPARRDQVRRAQPRVQGAGDGRLDGARLLLQAERVPQEQGGAADRGDRVGPALAGEVGVEPWIGS